MNALTTGKIGAQKFEDETLVDLNDGQIHTLTIFYMERGLYESNLKIRFNVAPVNLSEKYYTEIGTPIEFPVPDSLVSEVGGDGANVTGMFNSVLSGYDLLKNAPSKGRVEIKVRDGKKYFVYTADSNTDFAYIETLTIDTNNARATFIINNYKAGNGTYVIDYGLPVSLKDIDSALKMYDESVVDEAIYLGLYSD